MKAAAILLLPLRMTGAICETRKLTNKGDDSNSDRSTGANRTERTRNVDRSGEKGTDGKLIPGLWTGVPKAPCRFMVYT